MTNYSKKVLNSGFSALLLLCAGQAIASTDSPEQQCAAGVNGVFTESAPRDRFSFTNTSRPGWSVRSITIGLAGANGNLVFDTQPGGLGVEVFQPYKLEKSTASVAGIALPDDGDQSIEISFDQFLPGANYTFSIDIDDQLQNSSLGNIRVTGGELTGTEVVVEFVSESGKTMRHTSQFSSDNRTSITGDC